MRSDGLAAVWETLRMSAWVQLRAFRGPAFLVLGFVQPTVFVTIVLLSRHGTGGPSVARLALGTGLLSLWGATIWQCGYVLLTERRQGTLPALMTSVRPFLAILLGKCVGGMAQVGVSIAATVTVISLLLGDGITIADVPRFVASLAGSLVAAVAFGLLLSTLFLLTRAADRIAEALSYPVFIVGGLMVPVSLLPGWVQPLAHLVSLRSGAALVTAAATGTPAAAGDWIELAATTAAYSVAAVLLLRRVLVRARREGSLDVI